MVYDQDNEFRTALLDAIQGFELAPLTDEQSSQLERHYALLRKWNQKINLTRIIATLDVVKLHYAESLFGTKFVEGVGTILDIGSGAGFPAIPLAISRPDIQVTALEANQKKSLFLKEAKDELELANLKVVTARVEQFDWAGYEVLTSRALDRAEEMLPAIIERLRIKQRLILYCGRDLAAKMGTELKDKIETHPIPHSEARIIAIFSGAAV